MTPILKWLVILLAGIFILAYAINRDIRYDKEYPGDLRNRVVGERLVKDNKLPYFYKWKKADGIRYYDPNNFDSVNLSRTTVSPFYLHLMSPIADLPEATLSKYWLVLEYTALTIMTVLCLFLAKSTGQKQAVILFSLIFLLTHAWKSHVINGQCFIWIPFLALLFFVCMRRDNHFIWGLAAGTAAACLVFFRINTIFFFLPFLLLLPRYKRSWLMAFCLPPLLLAGWSLLDRQERSLWQNYASMLSAQVKVHQDLGHVVQINEPDPHFNYWEGVDKPAADMLSDTEPDKLHSENGNVFVLYRSLFKRQLPLPVLEITGMVCIAVLFLSFYSLHRPSRELQPEQLAIFAFCLYMISDLFSPVYRHQYYTVQWLFPLLLAAATWGRRQRAGYGLLLAGLLLSSIHFPFLKMGNTIAEYLILATLLVISLLSGTKWPSKTRPASPPASA